MEKDHEVISVSYTSKNKKGLTQEADMDFGPGLIAKSTILCSPLDVQIWTGKLNE